MFNFNSLASVQTQASSNPRLAPWGIYDVEFMGCRVENIQGKKDPNTSYEILKVKFQGENGTYEESIFFPKEEDSKRPVFNNSDGSKREYPSSFERTMAFIGRLAGFLNPDGFKKMQELSPKFKSFKDVCDVLIKITDPKINTKMKLKLIGRINSQGNVNACLPKFVALNKDGEVWLCDNFIGENLFFSDYEKKQMEEFKNAKPTKVEEANDEFNIVTEANSSNQGSVDDDIDLTSLL